MGRLLATVSFVLAFSFVPLIAQQKPLPELESPKQARPGQTALLTSPKGMHYFLRLPEDYDRKRGARLVVFMQFLAKLIKVYFRLKSFQVLVIFFHAHNYPPCPSCQRSAPRARGAVRILAECGHARQQERAFVSLVMRRWPVPPKNAGLPV